MQFIYQSWPAGRIKQELRSVTRGLSRDQKRVRIDVAAMVNALADRGMCRHTVAGLERYRRAIKGGIK